MSAAGHQIEEALRKSHCASGERDNPDHRCCGTMTVSPKGLSLECPKCGDDYSDRHPYDVRAEDRAKAILGAAGLDWDSLTDRVRQRVVREMRRAMCPGCGTEAPPEVVKRFGGGYYTCPCEEYSYYDGWKRKS